MESFKLFLLGGYDLEMWTIKQMLEGRDDCVIADKHLQWDNALLSAYQDELQNYADCCIYGIELKEDIPLPPYYHRIDHHNDLSGNPSSLEQVAEIIGTKLNCFQQLVAANDKGYIPAMQAMGASKEDIDEIRRKDRALQGVSVEDERLAELSISKNLKKYGGVTIVNSYTPWFSSICDRLFPFDRLLIYTDSELTFYGDGKSSLVERFAADIADGRIYHGGGSSGYIGAVKDAFTSNEITDFVTSIKERYDI